MNCSIARSPSHIIAACPTISSTAPAIRTSVRAAKVEGANTTRTSAATPALRIAAAILPGLVRPTGRHAAVASPAISDDCERHPDPLDVLTRIRANGVVGGVPRNDLPLSSLVQEELHRTTQEQQKDSSYQERENCTTPAVEEVLAEPDEDTGLARLGWRLGRDEMLGDSCFDHQRSTNLSLRL